MTELEALIAQAIKMKKLVEFYAHEHDQHEELGTVACTLATKLVMVIDKFPEADE